MLPHITTQSCHNSTREAQIGIVLLMIEILHHLCMYICTILPEFLWFRYIRSISGHQHCGSESLDARSCDGLQDWRRRPSTIHGPQKYVKQWLSKLIVEVLGHYSNFWSPGGLLQGLAVRYACFAEPGGFKHPTFEPSGSKTHSFDGFGGAYLEPPRTPM